MSTNIGSLRINMDHIIVFFRLLGQNLSQNFADSSMVFATALLVIVATGMLGGTIAKRLKQPLILGYIMAGVLVGLCARPFFSVQTYSSIESMADLGVALLLFSMGLEFSSDDLKPIWKIAIFGALAQVIFTLFVASGIAWLMYSIPSINFDAGSSSLLFENKISLFMFGVCFVSTSTAVILKTLANRGHDTSLCGRVMIGISIVQDLTVMPLMLVISQFASMGKSQSGIATYLPLFGSLAFMVVMIWAGRRFFPRLLTFASKQDSKEIFLLAVTAIALGAGAVSEAFQVSFSFGAFLAGIALSESEYGKKAFSELMPVRDLFAMLFFVSIGMMLDVHFLMNHALLVAVLVILTGLSRTIFLSAVTWIGRYRNVIPIAMLFGMFPTSEIAFVVISAGRANRMISVTCYSLILCVVVCSMIVGPLINELTSPVYSLLRRTILKKPELNSISIQQTGISGHVVFACMGKFAVSFAQSLKKLSCKSIIIASDYEMFQNAKNAGMNVIYGDAGQDAILSAAGIERANIFALGKNGNLATHLNQIALVHKMNPSIRILTYTETDEEEQAYIDAKADEILSVGFEASMEVLRRILEVQNIKSSSIRNHLDEIRRKRYQAQGGKAVPASGGRTALQNIIELRWLKLSSTSPLVGMTLSQTRIRAITGASIVGIIRNEQITSNPLASTILHAGDLLGMIGTDEEADALIALMAGLPIPSAETIPDAPDNP